VINTELGWDEKLGFSQAQVAKNVLSASLDAMKDGDVKSYVYAMFNDGSGNFGLMNPDGSPKPAGQALHNLTTLLQDTGGGFAPGSLNYFLGGSQGDNTLLMEKSDGSYWLSIWNESAGAHSVTLSLGAAASQIRVFDPLTGTNAVQTANNASSITLAVPDHPVIVEIGGGGAPASTPTPAPTPKPTPAPTPTPTAAPTPTPAPSTAAGDSGTPNPVLTLPGTQTVAAGQTLAIPGASVSDAWAANHPGTLALNVSTGSGSVSMKDANGSAVAGSGGGAIHTFGSLAQINADLANLTYTGGSAGSRVTVDVWDQAGAEATKSFNVTLSGSGSTGGTTPTPTPTPVGGTGASGGNTGATNNNLPTVTIAAGDATPVESVSNTNITASAGDHMIFISGTGNVLNATGGTETVLAFQGNNQITTGAGNDLLRYSGSNNVINAGAGQNVLQDSGSNNTIVLPGANQGFDNVYGYMMQNGDKFDLRQALSGTGWKGDMASIGNFVKIAQNGDTATVSIDPAGSGGSGAAVASLHSSGPVSLSTLLAHSIT